MKKITLSKRSKILAAADELGVAKAASKFHVTKAAIYNWRKKIGGAWVDTTSNAPLKVETDTVNQAPCDSGYQPTIEEYLKDKIELISEIRSLELRLYSLNLEIMRLQSEGKI